MATAKKIFLLLFLLATAAGAVAQTSDWTDYAYTDDGFSVSVPEDAIAKKDTAKAKDGSIRHTYYYNVNADSGFMAIMTDFHRKNLNGPALLHKTKIDTVAAVRGRLISQKTVMLGKVRGVQFEFTSKAYRARVRYFFFKGKLFGVMSLGPPGQPLLPDTDRFLDSLRLLDQAASPASGRNSGSGATR